MKDFNYYAPTEVAFGEHAEEQVASLVRKYGGTKVLVHYGGQSAVRSGLLDKICGQLQDDGMARKCSRDNTATCGCLKVLKYEDLEAIYRMARG